MGIDLIESLKIIPAAVIGLTVHEFSHGYTAYKLGDDTAKKDGRLTLNPLKHIDWMGFFLIVIAGFGWAKPVIFNPDNLKHKHRDEILISIAGPFSNFLLAILFFVIARLLYFADFFQATKFGLETINVIMIWGVINFSLFIFNLIPLPPLDGSHLYLTFLKEIHPKLMMNIYKYGTLVLFAIIIAESQFKIEILHLSGIIGFFSKNIIQVLSFH
ncbi:MAG: site-2 protease family protein [Bacteroidota bacterium]|nr:site-2 protease family protein [Bacteroidota bacterium]